MADSENRIEELLVELLSSQHALLKELSALRELVAGELLTEVSSGQQKLITEFQAIKEFLSVELDKRQDGSKAISAAIRQITGPITDKV